MKTIICVVGASGSGKTTICRHLENDYKIPTVVSFTTRPMREGEAYGVDHYFVKPEQKPASGDMLAYTVFGGFEYWVHRNQVDAVDSKVFTYVIDEDGVRWLRRNFGSVYQIVAVWIERRDLSRVDLERRHRDLDRKALQDYDVVILNDSTIENACKEMVKAIENF